MIDPFGVESAAADASLATFQRLYAPFYPSERQQDIVVVAIENHDLPLTEDAESDWPPRFDHYARMIDVIAGQGDFKPAGLFFDLLLDRRSTAGDPIDSLCAAIERAKARGVDVIFAAHPDLGRPAAFEDCETQPVITSATWRARDGAYGLSFEIGDKIFPTAAADLYRRSLDGETDIDAFDAALADREKTSSNDLTVMWGARAPVFNQACVPPVAEGARWRQSLRLVLSGVALDPDRRQEFMQQQKCLYHPQFSARQVMGATTPAQRRLAAGYFDGKFVFVGAALSDGLDYHPSPVHGMAPGVYLHAMALDNLLTYGTSYVRRPNDLKVPLTGAKLGAGDLLQAATLFLLAGVMALLTRRQRGRDRFTEFRAGALARLAAGGALFSVVAATVSITFFVYRWTPLNWGGVVIAGLLMIVPWNFVRNAEAL